MVQHEGRLHTYDRVDAPTLTEGFQELKVPVVLELSEVPTLVGECLDAKLELIAEELARQHLAMFDEMFVRVTNEAGNAKDLGGAPLTHDDFFATMERLHIDFGPDNQPTFTLETSPAIGAVLQAWQQDPAFMLRYNEVLARKWDAWRDRESHRKLVD